MVSVARTMNAIGQVCFERNCFIMQFMNRIVVAAAFGLAALTLPGTAANAQATTYDDTTPGFFDYTVGAGVTTLDVTLKAGGGKAEAGGAGGAGGLLTARLSGLSTGQVLRVIIGAGGGNSGSNGSGGASSGNQGPGGDLSAIAIGTGTDLFTYSYLLIAGGGGAGVYGCTGGAGGGLEGAAGSGFWPTYHGGGGTQTAGGAVVGFANAGTAGSHLQGGAGYDNGGSGYGYGGGGGGYYGGGGGGTDPVGYQDGGGGGGSSYSSQTAINGITVSDVFHTQGGGGAGGRVDYDPQTDRPIIIPAGNGSASLTVAKVASATPEPGTLALALIGGIGLVARRRKTGV